MSGEDPLISDPTAVLEDLDRPNRSCPDHLKVLLSGGIGGQRGIREKSP